MYRYIYSPRKCGIHILRHGCMEDGYSYYLNINQINETDKRHDLSLILDTKLAFNEHREIIASKTDRAIHSIF